MREERLTVVTLADVAARAGCSVMTASRVLSGSGYASEATRTAVLAAAGELGYVRNDVARSLRHNRTRTVALIISDIENSFYAKIARAAENALAQAGYRLLIASSDEDGARELAALRGIREMRAAALLITPTPHNREALEGLLGASIPVVALDRIVEGIACPGVLLENVEAAATAVDHLVARGHRRIAVVTGPHDTTTGSERAEGALRGGRRHRRAPEVTIIEAPSYLHQDSIGAVHAALAAEPTAIVAGNNIALEACLTVFAETGISVPQDMSLVSFDDVPWMCWVRSPITALRQPVETMTAAAVELLLRELRGEPVEPGIRRFPAELVERDSVARLTRTSAGG